MPEALAVVKVSNRRAPVSNAKLADLANVTPMRAVVNEFVPPNLHLSFTKSTLSLARQEIAACCAARSIEARPSRQSGSSFRRRRRMGFRPGLVVGGVLLRIGEGEIGERLVDGVTVAHIARDDRRIAGAGVGARQRPAA